MIIGSLLNGAELIQLPKVKEAPDIDGELHDQSWQNLPWHSGFSTLRTKNSVSPDSRFKICHDGKKIYLAVEALEPLPQKIKANPVVFDSSTIWLNDSFEFFICTDNRKQYFYQIIADFNGQICDSRYEDNNAGGFKSDFVWSSGAQCKCSIAKDRWNMELAIPFGSFDFSGKTLSFNIVRNRNAQNHLQISSFAKNPYMRHTHPEIFITLQPENLPPTLGNQRLNFFKADFFKDTVKLRLHISNNDKELKIVQPQVRLLNLEGNLITEKIIKVPIPPQQFVEQTLSLENVASGEYLLEVLLFNNSSQPNLLSSRRQQVKLEYCPIEIIIANPSYRDSIFSTMTDKIVRAEIRFTDFYGKPATAELSSQLNTIKRWSFFAQKTQSLQYDFSKLPIGDYTLSISAGSQENPVKISRRLRKLAYQPGEVWVDNSGITHIDGKPFFPFGWYGNDDSDAPKPHLNSVLDTALYPTPQTLAVAFAKRNMLGEKMLIFPYQEFNANGNWKIFSAKNRQGGLTAEQREYLTKFIPTIRNNPALLGYYMADEPENRDNNPRWYQEIYKLLRELDPYHPCIMLNWGPGGIKRFYNGCDILLPDCYPTYFADGSTGKPRHCSSEWAITATALRPSWFMPQVASWPMRNRNGVPGVPPNYDELRSQFFQALIHNVKGFNLYAYFESQRFASLMLGPDAIGKTLQSLKDYLLPNTIKNGIKFELQPNLPDFQAGFKCSGNKQCLIAVNTVMKPVKANFTFNVHVDKVLYVAGENRFVNVKNNSFTDYFAPGETHVYVNNSTVAAKVPIVNETKQAIDKLRNSRKKTGNLIGQGEMKVADYFDYSNCKLPPEVPQLIASSDPKDYFVTAKTGSRYYLLDGICNPKRVEYTWAPARTDKNPFIEIKLPKIATLNELRLYTPNGNLKSGVVIVNGRQFSFKNSSSIIPLALNGVVADKVRIEFKEFDIEYITQNPQRRLLSEIELYGN